MSYISEVLADRPTGFWLLNDPAGSTVAVEYRGKTYLDGAYEGSPALGGAGLLATGPAVETSSTSDVKLPALASLGTYFTIEFWFRYISGTAPIFRDGTSTAGWYLDLSGTHPVIGLSLGNDNLPFSHTVTSVASSSLKDSARHHLALTGDGSRTRFYIDGAIADDWSGGGGQFAWSLYFGKDGLNSGHSPCDFAAVAFYPATLPATRIAAHYAAADEYAPGIAGATAAALPVAYRTPGQAQVATTALPVPVSAPVFTSSAIQLISSTVDATVGPLDTPDPRVTPIHVVSPSVPTPTLVDGRPQ